MGGWAPPKLKFKNAYFADTVISNILHDLPFSQNHVLTLANK